MHQMQFLHFLISFQSIQNDEQIVSKHQPNHYNSECIIIIIAHTRHFGINYINSSSLCFMVFLMTLIILRSRRPFFTALHQLFKDLHIQKHYLKIRKFQTQQNTSRTQHLIGIVCNLVRDHFVLLISLFLSSIDAISGFLFHPDEFCHKAILTYETLN